ncbi:hypothetical protein MTO96_026999 [Rhipicephalus appendiculatus]
MLTRVFADLRANVHQNAVGTSREKKYCLLGNIDLPWSKSWITCKNLWDRTLHKTGVKIGELEGKMLAVTRILVVVVPDELGDETP